MIPPKLEQRAADYYSFQVGHLPKAKYSGFLSPAYREIADPEGLSQLDTAMRSSTAPSERFPRIKANQITVQRDGGFALTTVDSSLGGPFRDGRPLRWVHDGRGWFIYLGSDAEVAKYGAFPASLAAGSPGQHRPDSTPPMLEHVQPDLPPVPMDPEEAGASDSQAEPEEIPEPPADAGEEQPAGEG